MCKSRLFFPFHLMLRPSRDPVAFWMAFLGFSTFFLILPFLCFPAIPCPFFLFSTLSPSLAQPKICFVLLRVKRDDPSCRRFFLSSGLVHASSLHHFFCPRLSLSFTSVFFLRRWRSRIFCLSRNAPPVCPPEDLCGNAAANFCDRISPFLHIVFKFVFV